jgi:CO dehydrogenase/acetyl-CoA synthase beta subunit
MGILIMRIIQGYSNWLWYLVYPPYKKKQKELFTNRLKICESCEFISKTRQCDICKCFVDAKTKVIYDHEDGLAIHKRDKNGDVYYACPKEKW